MLTPVVKEVTVDWTPAAAFTRFTEGIGSWWPLHSHSVGQDRAETVLMEPRVGGRIVERIRGGEESVWGTITAWEPPGRVAFTWHPGSVPARATEVEVTFAPAAAGTRLRLVHTGWEALGALAKTARRGYPIGWVYVLRCWAGRRNSPLMWGLDALGWLLAPLQRRMAARAQALDAAAGGQRG